ncbi:amino acid adenylation domain-containing protein, partial [Amycolatopsis sp.]|uniref:amino acid adenylation domain-containing protein n=1 Tax=Amycolatopsis sp. TaxID=37632 RepID=UPI002D80C2E4
MDRIAGDGRGVADVYPLTPMQSGMLFHSLAEPDADVYLGHFGVVLEGADDVGRLAEAWQRVIDRTPILRTAVVWEGVGRPVQVVHRQVPVPVVHTDLRALPESERAAETERLWEARTAEAIDLTKPPLMRLKFLRLSDTSVRIHWASHHLLLDGWSFAQVLTDVFTEYAALSGNTAAASPPRPPYRDYVAWLAGQDEAAAEEYWRTTLSGLAGPTPLPFDRAPARVHGSRSSRFLRTGLPEEPFARLSRFAAANGLTVNTVVQGAWAILLFRYSGEPDVCFGATVSGRPPDLPGADEMPGLFINTLPVRVRVSEERPAVSFLRDLQALQGEARQYEYVSLAQIQNWSAGPRGVPLFESVVVFENYPYDADAAARSGLHAREFIGEEHTNYPLALSANTAGALNLSFGYDPQLFDRDTVDQLAAHFVGILEALPSDPLLSGVPVLTDAERVGMLTGWNDTARPYAADRGVPALFAEHVRRRPGAVALVHGGVQLTYGELDARANRWAHHLAAHGVGPEAKVIVFLRRSVEAVVGMLAILKAGGVYVPLYTSDPAQRVRQVAADTAAAVVLTDRATRSRVDVEGVPVLVMDDDPAVAARPAVDPRIEVRPDQLAYLMYTSGSTGTPKGVGVTHRGIAALVGDRHWRSAAHRAVIFHSPHAFDAATYELWVPLLGGGRMVIAEEDLNPETTRQLIAAHGITAMFVSAALFSVFAEESPDCFAGLAEVWTGGEAISVPTLEQVKRSCPETRVFNAYGPTEITMCSLCGELTWDHVRAGVIPLGSPMDNSTIYLLDRRLRPVPPGAPGEIYIGGPGLARGYAGQPALTAQRFVADPFSEGGRLYRTGDLGRWTRSGTVEFLGRSDDQLKIRGFRVEVGEIEAALRAHPGVAAAAVVGRGSGAGRKQLVAYVVPAGGSAPAPAEVQAFLRGTLPDYLVPSAIVPLAELPVTGAGKVDRKRLPDPGFTSGAATLPPRTETEARLVRIWAEVLGADREAVGVRDDFFDLGGDSVLSIQVVSRIRSVLGRAVTTRQLFDTPTIETLAGVLDGGTPADPGPEPTPESVTADRD